MKHRVHIQAGFPAIVLTAVAVLLLMIVLGLVFPDRVDDAERLMARNGLAFILVLSITAISGFFNTPLRSAMRTVGVLLLISFLFDTADGVQHLLAAGWQDKALIEFESRITGVELSILLQSHVHPVLTEWMMMSYVLYIPLLPLIAWLCYRVGGEPRLYQYLFSLLAVNVLCVIGFVLYPIASQLFYDPAQYSVPLAGGPFTAAAEWIRENLHSPGRSFPSPHCAAGTVMLVFLIRGNRRWTLIAAPFLLCILPATVYGRFHYVSDGIVGIFLALAVLRIVLPARISQNDRAVSKHRMFPGLKLSNIWRLS